MKILKLVSISVVALIVVVIAALRIFGLDPQDQRPGVWLTGEANDTAVTDWSFTDEHEEVFVQTNTRYGIPHSITTYSTDFAGNFYLFSAYYGGGTFPDDRGWNRNVTRDPNVRVKIGELLYDRQLSY